jgi:hypothetical protein
MHFNPVRVTLVGGDPDSTPHYIFIIEAFILTPNGCFKALQLE